MFEPHDEQPSGRQERAAVVSVHVAGPKDATVRVAVEHWDPDEGTWSTTGELSLIAPADSTLRIPALGEEMRFKVTGDAAQVSILPTRWLPC